MQVRLNQTGSGIGTEARWENETMGEWGYLSPSAASHWEATIPLTAGPNEVVFTVYDQCGSEGHSSYTLISTTTEDFCGDGDLDPGEECDDGNGISGDCCSGSCQNEAEGDACEDNDVCTPTSTCQSGACIGAAPSPVNCGNSYLCYRSAVTPQTPRFERVYDHPLSRDGVATTAYLRIPQNLCLAGIDDLGAGSKGSSQWIAYAMKETSASTRPPTVVMTDRFGTANVRLGKATGLLSPAGMALDSTATALGNGEMDSMMCYGANIRRKGPAFNKIVSLEDPLESRSYVIRKPSRLCFPVGVSDQPAANDDAYLMCYVILRAPGEPRHQRVTKRIHLTDGFGSLQLDTRREYEFCVPATVRPES